tara:strand:- start:59784 stop:60797 length:1014 start_codon:yes stop_codon:yes gene_type:complete
MSFNTKFNRRSFLMTGAALAGGLALAPRSVLAAQYRIDLSVNAGSSELAFAELFDTLGIAQKWDVELNTTPIADGSRIIASLISGTAAMCPGSGFSNVLVAIEKGADLKLVCGNSDKIAQAVFTKRDDIQSISDLAGKTIAVGAPGALLHQYMIAILRKHGVDPSSVNFVNAGSSTNTFRAAAGGTVDAAPGLLNALPLAEEQGLRVIAEVWEEVPSFPYQAGYASSRAIRDQREEIIRTICCYGDLYNFIQSDAPEAKGSYVDAFVNAAEMNREAAAYQWEWVHANQAYSIDLMAESIDFLQDLNLEAGLQTRKLPIEEIADFSLLEEAKQRLGLG